jgi:hypothetical protein
MILYKYCDHNGIDLLRKLRIKLTSLENINDPFEFLPQQTNISTYQTALDELRKYQTDNYRIMCFSKNPCSLLMWGHYSDDHKGLLFVLDSDKMNAQVNGEPAFQEVQYSSKRLFIDLSHIEKESEETLHTVLRDLCYTKHTAWSYEEEVRAIVRYDQSDAYDFMDIPTSAILKVVLGLNSDDALLQSIQNLLRQDGFNHIQLTKAELHPEDYTLIYHPIS